MREVAEPGWHIKGTYVHMLNPCADSMYLDGTIFLSHHFSVAFCMYGQVVYIKHVLGNLAARFQNRGPDLALLLVPGNLYQNFPHKILHLLMYLYFTSTKIAVGYGL